VSSLLAPDEPLHERVPTRGPEGQRLADFMMIIPRLRDKPEAGLRATVAELEYVLGAYGHLVVYADLNLRLNLLWVSLKPVPGMCLEVATAIKSRVPEALLVANKREAMGG
ncbi:MAG TPA: hypothetical protein VKA55_00045, partial [Gammaproteobacteria bacterium]|nr:hypothetical protein [Gammaproteobacteria bacterium]